MRGKSSASERELPRVSMQQKELRAVNRKSCIEGFAAEIDFSKHKWESRHLFEGESDTKKDLAM